MIALASCRITYPEGKQPSERNTLDRPPHGRFERKIYSHIAKRMTAASELQVTRVTSNPRSPFESGPAQQKKKGWRTCCDVTESDDGDRWKDSIDDQQRCFRRSHGGRGRKIVRLVSGSARSRIITEGKSGTFRTHSKTKNRGAKRGKRA